MPSESEDIKVVASKVAQSQGAKKATLDLLRGKKRSNRTVPFMINDEELIFEFSAIGAKAYDALLTKCPPTTEQRAEGSQYNINTFAPALLARVVVDPELSESDWTDIWNSPDWNRGEVMSLFGEAVNICNIGLSVGPTAVV